MRTVRYFLALERNVNDYYPIDWHLSIIKPIGLQNIDDLLEIDKLTSQMDEHALKQIFVEDGLLEEHELSKNLVIIFKEKEKTRKLDDGILLPGEKEGLTPEYISNFILKNANNKEMMNLIYTQFCTKAISKEFRGLLDGINYRGTDSSVQFVISLQNLQKMSYNEIRKLGLYIKRKLEPIVIVDKDVHPTLNVVRDDVRRGE